MQTDAKRSDFCCYTCQGQQNKTGFILRLPRPPSQFFLMDHISLIPGLSKALPRAEQMVRRSLTRSVLQKISLGGDSQSMTEQHWPGSTPQLSPDLTGWRPWKLYLESHSFRLTFSLQKAICYQRRVNFCRSLTY